MILRRGRIGHGTALVSPSAREGGNPSGVARDATGLLMGGGAGAGGEGAEDPTDLDLAIRQVRVVRETSTVGHCTGYRCFCLVGARSERAEWEGTVFFSSVRGDLEGGA